MSVAMELGQFALGLLLLVLGADSFVRGASGLAIRFGISPFVVGLVLVGLGTSAPELSVNLTAAFAGRYEMAIGNEIGRAHVCTPVTNAHLVCRLLLEKQKKKQRFTIMN